MNYLKHIIYIIFLLSAISSCGNKKKTTDGLSLKRENWKVLVDSLENNNFDYQWIRSKASAKINYKEDKNTVKANFRIRKDSASWINLSKGIQIMTAIASIDSIKVLKKIGGKEYYLDNFKTVNKFLNTEVDYSLLEDFFAGNAIGFDYQAKYKSGIDDGLYILSSEKIKKLNKILNKGKAKDILYRCWINPTNFKCEKVRVDLLASSTSLTVKYSDWKQVENGGLFPYSSSIELITPKDTALLSLKYSKIVIDKKQTMPFRVTDSYKPMVFE